MLLKGASPLVPRVSTVVTVNGPLCRRTVFVSERETGTRGQRVTVPRKPPGDETSQKQQLTNAPKEQHTFTFIHQKKRGLILTYFAHADRHQLRLSVLLLTHLLRLFSLCNCGAGPWKPYVVSSPCLLISRDSCVPLGGLEFEHFIRAHESIKSHVAVRHGHMDTLYPHVEPCQERSQHQ